MSFRHSLKSLVLNWGKISIFIPETLGHLTMSGDIFDCSNGGRCYWRLVGRGQGCSYIPYNTQDSPSQQRVIEFKMSVLRLKSPVCSGLGMCSEELHSRIFAISIIFFGCCWHKFYFSYVSCKHSVSVLSFSCTVSCLQSN